MQISDLTLAGFLLFGSLRIISYIPQIVCVARDAHGATAISYTTWSMWTLANLATASYAGVNLRDPYLAGVSCVYALCCAAVLLLTAIKRAIYRREIRDGLTAEDAGLHRIQENARVLILREVRLAESGQGISIDFERQLRAHRNRYLLATAKSWGQLLSGVRRRALMLV